MGEPTIRLLAVDDEPDILRLVRDVLAAEGFQVETAATLAEAEARLATALPDLVVLDWKLPDGEGIDLCRRMKSDRRLALVPVIMLTSRGDVADRVRGLETGADDYLTKPFMADELVARVRALLRRMARDRTAGAQAHASLLLRYLPAHVVDSLTFFNPGPVEGDRRVVALLVGDLVGFTELTEEVGAERISRLVNDYFGFVQRVVDAHGGVIDKLLGDAFLAVFGLPRTRTDDPLRALAAALALREEVAAFNRARADLKRPLRIRMAATSGPVIAGMVGGSVRMDYTVMGGTVNLVFRLQALAEPDQILATEPLSRRATERFRFRPLAPLAVKGVRDPVTISALEGYAEEKPAARVRRLSRPLVDRDAEAAALEAFAARLERGEPGRLALMGEAGVGKSRLLMHLQGRLPPETICQGRARGFPVEPYGLFREMFHDLVPGEAWARAAAGGEAGLAEQLRQGLEGRARRGPVLVVCENLHWAQSEEERVLAGLMRDLAGRVGFLLIARPERRFAWEAPGIETLAVGEMSTAHLLRLAENFLGGPLTGRLAALVKEKGCGNPLYVEELLFMLRSHRHLARGSDGWMLAREVTNVELPESVQCAIHARLSRLTPDVWRLLKYAAVLGRECETGLLARLCQPMAVTEPLRQLEAEGILDRKSVGLGGPVIGFHHYPVREAVYGCLLEERRREMHHQAGQAMEELYRQDLPRVYAALVFHYRLAGHTDRAEHFRRRLAEHEAHQAKPPSDS